MAQVSRRSWARQAGFTMIELLAVLAIMAIVMGVTITSFLQMTRTSGMRAAVLNVKSALVMARQSAITRRVRAEFRYGNTKTADEQSRGYYVVAEKSGGDLVNTNYLAPGVMFGDGSGSLLPEGGAYQAVPFKLDGTCGTVIRFKVELIESRRKGGSSVAALTNMIEVMPLTGIAKVRQ